MLISAYRPRNAREWQSVLGIDNQCFTKLVKLYGQTYEVLKGHSLTDTIKENPQGKKFKFQTYEELVFFLLFALKSGITFDQLAFIFQMDLSNAKRNFDNTLKMMHKCLEFEDVLPIRHFGSPREMEHYFSPVIEIIIDGTEQMIERPANDTEQREFYSYRKKSHTRKCLIISTKDTYVHFISAIYSGRQHDFSIIKQEFPPAENWFENLAVRLDLGYLGFDKEYPNAMTFLPHKNYKKRPLNEIQKESNKKLSKSRIRVEHSIGGIKRYEMAAGRSRLKDEDIYDKMLTVCAGLWNFFITN